MLHFETRNKTNFLYLPTKTKPNKKLDYIATYRYYQNINDDMNRGYIMNIKSCVLAAALVFAGAVHSNAASTVTNGGFDGNLSAWNFSSVVNWGLSRAQDRGVVDTILPGSGWISQTLNLVAGNYSLAFDGLYRGAGSTLNVSINGFSSSYTNSQISGAKTLDFSIFTDGSYTLAFGGKANGALNAFVAVDNVALTNVTSVPGPEAGAGLGALAMGGLAFWMNRRRKDTQTA